MPQTTVGQRVAMMNGARPQFTEYVDNLETALQDLIVWAGSMGGWDAPAWERADKALHAADGVKPVATGPARHARSIPPRK